MKRGKKGTKKTGFANKVGKRGDFLSRVPTLRAEQENVKKAKKKDEFEIIVTPVKKGEGEKEND